MLYPLSYVGGNADDHDCLTAVPRRPRSLCQPYLDRRTVHEHRLVRGSREGAGPTPTPTSGPFRPQDPVLAPVPAPVPRLPRIRS